MEGEARKQFDEEKASSKKDPKYLSSCKKIPVRTFGGMKDRQELFPQKESPNYYDSNKEFTMKGLQTGVVPWKKMKNRAEVVDTKLPQESPMTCDYKKAIMAKTQRLKPKVASCISFQKQRGRDELLLRQNESYANVLLENTKKERKVEIQA